jgi:hypothetical protein
VSYQLLEQWLAEPPPPEMLIKWKAYIEALSATLSKEARQALKSTLLGRARGIADAAGGFLGIGSRVSSEEKTVLDELERSFPQGLRRAAPASVETAGTVPSS